MHADAWRALLAPSGWRSRRRDFTGRQAAVGAASSPWQGPARPPALQVSAGVGQDGRTGHLGLDHLRNASQGSGLSGSKGLGRQWLKMDQRDGGLSVMWT